jgi:hypothetical protein
MQTNNLETFSLIWLDESNEENIIIQQRLRTSINHLKRVQNPQICEDYIREMSNQDRVILIISDQWCQELIPHIHQYRQVSSIYIYCTNDTIKENKEWAKNFPKVLSF